MVGFGAGRADADEEVRVAVEVRRGVVGVERRVVDVAEEVELLMEAETLPIDWLRV